MRIKCAPVNRGNRSSYVRSALPKLAQIHNMVRTSEENAYHQEDSMTVRVARIEVSQQAFRFDLGRQLNQ